MNTTNEHKQMWESLQDPDFRKQLIDEHINVGIAFQIHGLRERQELKQKQLAERLGDEKKQPLISAWENPNYGKYTLATLKELAKAFDVGLLVRFVPFSKLVDWTVNLTSDVIAPPSFPEEQLSFTGISAEGLTGIIATMDDTNLAFLKGSGTYPGIMAGGAKTVFMGSGASYTAKASTAIWNPAFETQEPAAIPKEVYENAALA